MIKNKLLELYAKYLWPIIRNFVRLSKRCNQCILSEKYIKIKNGICDQCKTFNENLNKNNCLPNINSNEVKKGVDESVDGKNLLDGEFNNFINSYCSTQSLFGKYDALFLLSGGKDSAFILNQLRAKYPKLKLLCITVDNGFMSPYALKNAYYIADKTETDLLICHSERPTFSSTLRNAFLELKGKGSYGVVDFADGKLIFQIAEKVALERGIPLVISGLSWVQVQLIVGSNHFFKNEESGIKMVFPLAVWKTNEQHIRKYVRDQKLLLPGSESPIVSNSSLILAMSILDVMNLGYSSFEPEFAQLIREGKTDRKSWLYLFELLEYATKHGFLKKDLVESLRKMNLFIDDVIGGKN